MLTRIRKSMEDKDQGFTLIELLVVMIIIGILAAIAIPVFLNQQKKARETSAKADVSTIGKDIATYYVDGTLGLTAAGATAGGTWTLTPAGAGAAAIASGQLSKGNTVAAHSIVSGTNFCVAVQPSDGAASGWKYTNAGLVAGATCP